MRPARRAGCATHSGSLPAAPAAGRVDARRDAPRADREQGPGAAGPHPTRGRRGRGRMQLARDHLADIRALDARLKSIAGQITALVTGSGTTLTSLYGIGPLIAGRILAEVGDITRFPTRDKFASCN